MDCIPLGGLVEEIINTIFGPMVILSNDVRIGNELKTQGCWDIKEILDTIRSYERFRKLDSSVILDVGCNVGAWSLPIARRYPNHQVLAFDCQALLIRCFDQTIEKNNLQNIKSSLTAISDSNGEIRFGSIDYTFGGNFGAFELEPAKNSDFNGVTLPGQFTTIPKRTIDSFELDNVGLIKIDVEGMEYKVLKGAVGTLQKCQSVVLFENHKCDYNEILNLLDSIDYRIINTVGQMSCAVSKK